MTDEEIVTVAPAAWKPSFIPTTKWLTLTQGNVLKTSSGVWEVKQGVYCNLWSHTLSTSTTQNSFDPQCSDSLEYNVWMCPGWAAMT